MVEGPVQPSSRKELDRLIESKETTVICSWFFNSPIEEIDLQAVKRLNLGWSFDHPIENLDLKDLEELVLSANFVHPIEKLNLRSLKLLNLGIMFDKPIEKLNLQTLETLILSDYFDHSISQLNLGNLRHLKFGTNFNQPFLQTNNTNRDSNPDTDSPHRRIIFPLLETLEFGYYFNQSLVSLELPNLRKLIFHEQGLFNSKLPSVPESCEIRLPFNYVGPLKYSDLPLAEERGSSTEHCSVCETSDQLVVLLCQHVFCFSCITEWFEINQTCPSCREDYHNEILIEIAAKFF